MKRPIDLPYRSHPCFLDSMAMGQLRQNLPHRVFYAACVYARESKGGRITSLSASYCSRCHSASLKLVGCRPFRERKQVARSCLASAARDDHNSTCLGHIDRSEFRHFETAVGWTNRRSLAFRPTAGGARDLCSCAVTMTITTPRHAESNYTAPRDAFGCVFCSGDIEDI